MIQSMADMNKLLQFPSPFLKSPLSFPIPLQLSSHHVFFPLHRPPLSLSSIIPHFSSPSNPPNSLLISTSLQSDGSLVFKFSDASEIPPPEIQVELETQTPHSNELQNDDLEPKDFSQVEEIAEKTVVDDSVKDQLNSLNLAQDSIVEDNTSESGSDVGVLDSEVALEDEQIEEEMIQLDVDEAVELPLVQSEAEPILDDEVNYAVDQPPQSYELQNDDLEPKDFSQVEEFAEKTVVDDSLKYQPNPLNLAEDSIVEDSTSQSGSEGGLLDSKAGLEDEQIEEEMIQLDVDEAVELPLVQFEAEPILDDEVNYVGLPSIAGEDESPSGATTDVAFPSLEESVVISETNVNREEISLHSEDISPLSLPMSSVSYPLKFNDAVPSAILQCDDNPETKDICEPAGPVPELSGTASEEAHLNGVQTSTVALSVPSAMASLPQATKVNDAITPSIKLSDADLHSEIVVAADPGSGISAAAAEINRRVENSAPSLCVVSAAASVAHPAEASAGGDDAYFVCDNWFGVADGVGQWSFGGIDKGLYAQELIQNCERLARKSVDTGLNCLKELLQESAAKTESFGAARVLVAHIVDQVLHVANIGDSGFIIVRNGTVFKKSSPMFHEFNFPYAVSFGENPVEAIEEYHVELEDGDIIVTATDGLFDNLYEREIASLVFKSVENGKNVKDIAELLASRSQEVGRSSHVRTPYADAAQAAGHTEFRGGKFDHVTVIVSAVQKE